MALPPVISGQSRSRFLAYLALEPGPHSRDELTALLWGEYPDEKAKASLRQALTHLREAAPDAIRVDRTSVALTDAVSCDVTTFLRYAKESPRAAADCAIHRFLDGLQLRRSPAFDEWADATRASLVRRLSEVLTTVTREAIATRQWRDATRYAERWVTIAPLSAAANGARIEAHFHGGRARAALEAFAEYRARLVFGARSDARAGGRRAGRANSSGWLRKRRGVRRPRNGTRTRRRSRGASSGVTASGKRSPDLGGRSATAGRPLRSSKVTPEWARVDLAGDFLRWVSAAGGTVLRGRALRRARWRAVRRIIEALRSGDRRARVGGHRPAVARRSRAGRCPSCVTRFPDCRRAASPITADSWRLFEGIAQVLTALAEESPVAVFIDDLQWCDADSCALLHSLIRRLDGAPMLWCLTFSPGAVERDTPAARLVRALRAFPRALSLALRPLSEDDVWQLLRSARSRERADRRATAGGTHSRGDDRVSRSTSSSCSRRCSRRDG